MRVLLVDAPVARGRRTDGGTRGAVAALGAEGCDAVVATPVTPAGVWR
jgi:hypothetical protein